ncbi:GNAT family N-acetyltransferase [Levilactobacillus spicheri]|uniref:Acetyltransferase n=1 Tax=Levilactobacillus spicheri TaxID=216463 RepID=A0A0F3RVD1_9LACO|nr:GNAT family N-acetyltransferase [Levilactobacillus spicheri]KJW13988.1 acetyltransferase [Levilactobacillus spicheri]
MHLRAYQPTDLTAVRTLFRDTVERVNWRDYSPEQLQAWIGPDDAATRAAWQATLCRHRTLVALDAERVVGFADMSEAGYLDRLYVAATHQRQGIARALVLTLEQMTPAASYTTLASITARPFFEHQGYRVVRENQVTRAGVALTNFAMHKDN